MLIYRLGLLIVAVGAIAQAFHRSTLVLAVQVAALIAAVVYRPRANAT